MGTRRSMTGGRLLLLLLALLAREVEPHWYSQYGGTYDTARLGAKYRSLLSQLSSPLSSYGNYGHLGNYGNYGNLGNYGNYRNYGNLGDYSSNYGNYGKSYGNRDVSGDSALLTSLAKWYRSGGGGDSPLYDSLTQWYQGWRRSQRKAERPSYALNLWPTYYSSSLGSPLLAGSGSPLMAGPALHYNYRPVIHQHNEHNDYHNTYNYYVTNNYHYDSAPDTPSPPPPPEEPVSDVTESVVTSAPPEEEACAAGCAAAGRRAAAGERAGRVTLAANVRPPNGGMVTPTDLDCQIERALCEALNSSFNGQAGFEFEASRRPVRHRFEVSLLLAAGAEYPYADIILALIGSQDHGLYSLDGITILDSDEIEVSREPQPNAQIAPGKPSETEVTSSRSRDLVIGGVIGGCVAAVFGLMVAMWAVRRTRRRTRRESSSLEPAASESSLPEQTSVPHLPSLAEPSAAVFPGGFVAPGRVWRSGDTMTETEAPLPYVATTAQVHSVEELHANVIGSV